MVAANVRGQPAPLAGRGGRTAFRHLPHAGRRAGLVPLAVAIRPERRAVRPCGSTCRRSCYCRPPATGREDGPAGCPREGEMTTTQRTGQTRASELVLLSDAAGRPDEVGVKAANVGAIMAAGFPVPDGVVLTANAL